MNKNILITLVIALFSSNLQAQVNLDSGLVAYYPFNGNANDESGNEYHGTINGAILTSDRFNYENQAFSFDGINDFISSTPVLPINNQMRSISAWFNTISASGSNGWFSNTITSYGSPSNNNLCGIAVYSSKLMFSAFGTSYDVYTNEIVNDGNWHHVVVTYNSTLLKIYLDNAEVASENRNLNTVISNFYIGRRAGQENQYMDGLIDDIRLYDRTLSVEEIDSLYNELPTFLEGLQSNYPTSFELKQNFPNPFNPSTNIRYVISNTDNVTLKVYDVLGKEVATLVNQEKMVGSYEEEFDGRELTSGIYFYKLEAGSFVETKKMVYLR